MQIPSELGLPYPNWREGQVDAIKWIENNNWLRSQDDKNVKVIEAPTGTGKTGLILALSAMNPDLRILVLCATKLEQEQYENNITPYYQGFASIKGRNNFHCKLENDFASDTCDQSFCYDIHVDQAKCTLGTDFKCPIKDECSYFKQIEDIQEKNIVVTNYAYGLTMLNYVTGKLGEFDVIVEDEGHVLDAMMERFIEVKISRKHLYDICGLDLPSYNSINHWKEWCEDYEDTIKNRNHQVHTVTPENMDIHQIRVAKRSEAIVNSVNSIKHMNPDWIVEPNESEVPFMPVWVREDSKRVLFQHADKHIIMSGTIPSEKELAKKVGVVENDFEFHRMPYVYPAENRQIVIKPIAPMSAKYIDINLPLMASAIDDIIGSNLDKKILIHTVNYKIAHYLEENSIYENYMFTHSSKDRIEVLNTFKEAQAPAVLISPSFDKAVDLPDKECELIIVAKVPFPYLGTKVMRKRVKQNGGYYDNETLSTLIQMSGRGVRSETDVCPTIILDSNIVRFLNKCRASGLIPQGIEESIVEI